MRSSKHTRLVEYLMAEADQIRRTTWGGAAADWYLLLRRDPKGALRLRLDRRRAVVLVRGRPVGVDEYTDAEVEAALDAAVTAIALEDP